ncbi:putative ferric-chelate reductase (NADH) [Lupinus albus]|uniref:Putative ferric-chelate reductase (NADH) n=1 Tax=Lupinus albus TaxID=3870 RepID=A0A6A4NP14_LUPAL|nr:putative ferric-chelate reductase (NADH) [Lupinus albus]
MFINITSISKLQSHPFTVTSNSNLENENMSVVIKSDGTWTQRLYKLLSTHSAIDRLGVSVEGPYGPASTNFLRHDTLVLISGGSGITPFISIIRELLFLKTTIKCKTPKVVLICSFGTYSSLSMINLILPVSSTPYDISNLEQQLRPISQKTRSLNQIATLNFKSNGPNSWLWLGAIISLSLIIFLIIIGIIGRYYIFPIDHNSNKIFSFPLKSFLHMLIICGSIAMIVSAVVLLNKKNNTKEAKKIQNLEMSTPTMSPSSMIYNVDRELESLPCQSLIQAPNVHYGVRPDLKRLLFEVKGSSVKVFASGSKKMRQEVAAICSSGLAENLHFESINFSW